MANNPVLDRLMLEAAAAAYNVSIVTDAEGNQRPTITGADPNGQLYNVDANGVITGTSLAGRRKMGTEPIYKSNNASGAR